jgi:hypothetical protein
LEEPKVNRAGPLTVLGDKGYADADFETFCRPSERDRISSIALKEVPVDALDRHLHREPLCFVSSEFLYWRLVLSDSGSLSDPRNEL